jgi:peptidoglycan/LPS O-acetylase OafA/YrhL
MAEKNGLAFNNPAFVGNSAPSEILPNALLLQSWLPNANTLSFNIVAWSISVEFYIYLIFGLLLFGNNSVKTTGIVLLAATGLLCLYFEVDFVKSAVARGLLCFFMGCLIYMIYEKIYTLSMGKGVSSVIESLLLIAIVAILVLMPVGNIKNILATFLFALTVLVFALEAGLISSFFKTGFLKYLGKLSYSIYIVHYVIWQILLSVAIIVSKLFKKELTFADGNVRVIATGSVITDYLLLGAFLVAVILVSHFTYNRIELKWMAFGKKYNAAAKEALVKN